MPSVLRTWLQTRLHGGIRTRLLLVGFVGLLALVILTGITMLSVRQQMIDDRVVKLKHLTEVGRAVLQAHYHRHLNGELDEASAKRLALAELRTMRYGDGEYFFVDDFDCNSVLLPNLPDWEGRNFANIQDSTGHYFVRTQRDTALAGGGTVFYKFPKTDGQTSIDKASYVLPFAPWNWFIATGIYLDEVDREIREILFKLLAQIAAVGLLAGIVVVQISRGITTPLAQLENVVQRLTRRDYSVTIDGLERTDEIGDIARAMEIFKSTGHQYEALQAELRQQEAAAAAERAAWFEQQRESAVRLEQSSRLITVGELATSLAHELNQPLATITNYCRGCVTLLEEGKTDPRTLLGPMRKATEQAVLASKIVSRIRTYLRPNRPKLDTNDLSEIIAETIELIEFDGHRQKISIHIDIVPDLPPVQADRIMIQQVVLNLLRNAVAAMQSPGSHGNTLIVQVVQDLTVIETRVIDCGPGVADDDWPRIFRPFFTTKSEGMGMGLNICRSIIEFHGGRLWGDNNPAGGAIFHFSLPLIEKSE
jgi:signal transduction histidine kinase